MEDLFNVLSASARLDKSKRKSKYKKASDAESNAWDVPFDVMNNNEAQGVTTAKDTRSGNDLDDGNDGSPTAATRREATSSSHNQYKIDDRKEKRVDHGEAARSEDDDDDNDNGGRGNTMSDDKLRQIHKEQIAAFRRSMCIRLGDKHDPDVPDPMASFEELLDAPDWWTGQHLQHYQDRNSMAAPKNNNDTQNISRFASSYQGIMRSILQNIEAGRWKEPTPIQMQTIPILLYKRRDVIGAAPTGSGKSGAFIVPALCMSSAPHEVYYQNQLIDCNLRQETDDKPAKKAKAKRHGHQNSTHSQQGQIRALLLAPSLELAAQLHREVQRLGDGKTGGLTAVLLSKSNAGHVASGQAGGQHGLDILVATPLRLVDAIQKGLTLQAVRIVVMDEADRLLDAADGSSNSRHERSDDAKFHADGGGSDDDSDLAGKDGAASGSTRTKSFLSQMDTILAQIPTTATRALFSATVSPQVRLLAESILRNPVDLSVMAPGTNPGGANPDIQQSLQFVGREEGKLLAIRQMAARAQLRPPVLIFLQSQDRAQALFGELLYDGLHVDVLHAGRSKSARERAVAQFRRGDTWILICTDLVARGIDFRAVRTVINYDLPTSGVTYVHRIGRTGRAGRKGQAITLFTEEDFAHLRTIANVMKQSGCDVADWMLQLPKSRTASSSNQQRRAQQPHRGGRGTIDTTPVYDKAKKHHKRQIIQQSKANKAKYQKVHEQEAG